MHISEGFLPPMHAAAWAIIAMPFLVKSMYRVNYIVREYGKAKFLFATSGAFIFVLSALKLPSVTGSCSHPTGTGLGAILFGPSSMVVICTVVLILQALLIGHGGLSTLGANVFSMAIAGPWCAYWVFYLLRKINLGIIPSIFIASFLGDLSTYLTSAIQLACAFPDQISGIGGSLTKFISVFCPTQLPLAIIDGLLTVAILNLLRENSIEELRILKIH